MTCSQDALARPVGSYYIDVVDGMTKEEAQQVLAYAVYQFNAWADFTMCKRRTDKVRPGFPRGWTISYVTKILFHIGQPTEVNSHLQGFRDGLRDQKGNQAWHKANGAGSSRRKARRSK